MTLDEAFSDVQSYPKRCRLLVGCWDASKNHWLGCNLDDLDWKDVGTDDAGARMLRTLNQFRNGEIDEAVVMLHDASGMFTILVLGPDSLQDVADSVVHAHSELMQRAAN